VSAPTWLAAVRLLQAGQADEGLSLLETAAQRGPDTPQVELLLGAAYTLQGNLAEALKALLAAQRLRPDDPQVAMGLGTVYEALGDRDSAARQYRKARAMSPGLWDAAAGLARVRHTRPPPTAEELDNHARHGAPPLPPPPVDLPEVRRAPGITYDLAPIAPLPLRLVAGLVDGLVALVPLVFPLLDSLGVLPFSAAGSVGVGGILFVLFANHLVLVLVRGQTVGKILCRLRVVQEDGSRLGWGQCLQRLAALVAGTALGGWGLIWGVLDPEHQAWHDRVAGTLVVRAE